MLKLLLIAIGGAAGTLARFGTSTALLQPTTRVGFPFGTLAVNLIGCLLIGYLNGLFLERLVVRQEIRYMLIVGFLGGYTTFSSFAFENAEMIRMQLFGRLAIYLLISNVLGVALVVAGYALGRPHPGN